MRRYNVANLAELTNMLHAAKSVLFKMSTARSVFLCALLSTVLALLLYLKTTTTFTARILPKTLRFDDFYKSQKGPDAVDEGNHRQSDVMPLFAAKNSSKVGKFGSFASDSGVLLSGHAKESFFKDILSIQSSRKSKKKMAPALSAQFPISNLSPTTDSDMTTNQAEQISSTAADETRVPVAPGRRRTIVILLTNARSGSTFLGQLFNQNDNVYYLFEPLVPFTTDCEYLQRERVELLESMLQCDFSTMLASYSRAFNISKYPDTHAQCLKNSMCFSERNTKVLDRYARTCYLDKAPPGYAAKSHRTFRFFARSKTCGMPLRTSMLQKVCAESDIVAFKILCICSLESLQPVFDHLGQRGYDVKVVHLVRDPRAVMGSRISAQFDGKLTIAKIKPETERLCGRYRRNMRYAEAKENSPDWKGRYMRIRYEDLAQNVMETAEEIYRFLGAHLPDNVKRWIDESQPDKVQLMRDLQREQQLLASGKGSTFKVQKLKITLQQFRDPYATKRDPNDTTSRWRYRMAIPMVRSIQNECKDVMEKLGYNLFHTVGDMRNMTYSAFS